MDRVVLDYAIEMAIFGPKWLIHCQLIKNIGIQVYMQEMMINVKELKKNIKNVISLENDVHQSCKNEEWPARGSNPQPPDKLRPSGSS